MNIATLDIDRLVAGIVAANSWRPRLLIGIDGPGASGKSTLAELICERMDGAVVVHVDDFFLPSSVRDRRVGETGPLFDLPRLEREVLVPASAGRAFAYQRYDWNRDALSKHVAVPAGVPVIVEGVYSFSGDLRNYYSFTIYCRAEHEVRLERGVARDGESMRATWRDEWMPEEARYEAIEDPVAKADLVVDSSRPRPGSVAYKVVVE